MTMRVLCVLHQAHSTTGQVGIALKQLGVQVQIVRPLVGQRLPRDLNRFDGLIVFGGPMSANDDHLEGIRRELKLIEQWLHRDRPLWGICLGAQLMSRALGASVDSHPEDRVEVGWYPLHSRGLGHREFGTLSHVYQWHREGYQLPPGATRLAVGAPGAAFTEQAYRIGYRALATQFHPEMHPPMMRRWLARATHMLELPGAHPTEFHNAGMRRYYAKQARWLKRTLHAWLTIP